MSESDSGGIEPWFERRIRRGMAALMTLRMEGHPPADTVEATAKVWAQALWRGHAWEEALDAARLGEAFRLIALRETRWPTPAVLLRHLPPRSQPQAAEQLIDATARERGREMLEEIKRMLRRKPHARGPR